MKIKDILKIKGSDVVTLGPSTPVPKAALILSQQSIGAAVPTMERVEVVELEPAIAGIAEACKPVNLDVLRNPKVHLVMGDAREVLLTSHDDFDIVFSEPSNPYRAGIVSLYTAEFYRAVADRLAPGGLFLQWLQGYEIDAGVVRTAYATLGSVFPFVETWRVHRADLLFVASGEPLRYDVDALHRRLAAEPYRSALAYTWGVAGVEGLLTGYIGDASFARSLQASAAPDLNTDDRPTMEFGFVRNLGRQGLFSVESLRQLARQRGEERPTLVSGTVDWEAVEELRELTAIAFNTAPPPIQAGRGGRRDRHQARTAWSEGRLAGAEARWRRQPLEPTQPQDVLMVAEALAETSDPEAPTALARLEAIQPTEAAAVRARWLWRSGRREEGLRALVAAFERYRADPWPKPPVMLRSLNLAREMGQGDPQRSRILWEALGPPFAVELLREPRLIVRVQLAEQGGLPALCQESYASFEPHVPWSEPFLRSRYRCYAAVGDPRTAKAATDLGRFLASEPPALARGLPASTPDDRR